MYSPANLGLVLTDNDTRHDINGFDDKPLVAPGPHLARDVDAESKLGLQ